MTNYSLPPGAKPTVPALSGVDSEHVFMLRTVEDALRIRHFVEEQKAAIRIKSIKNPAAELHCSGVCLCAETAEKPYFKRFSGIEKVYRNSIKITVDLWRREGDSNPWYGDYRTHDFQSCSFGQLGHLSKYRSILYQINYEKSRAICHKICFLL